MKHKFKHIVKGSKAVALSSNEKDEIKASLLRHVENHPLTPGSGNFIIPKHVSYFKWIGISLSNKKFMVPVVFSFLIILTTGISFASSSSLPGNLLYPVKILSEKIDSLLTFDPIDKVKLLTINTITRLEEAEKLFVEGRLDEETEVRMAESFENNSELATESIFTLEKNNKESWAEVSHKFRNDLDKHHKILNSFFSVDDKKNRGNTLSKKVNVVIAKLNSSSNDTDILDKDGKSDKKMEYTKKTNTSTNIKATVSTPISTSTLNASTTSNIELSLDGKEENKNTENNNDKSSTDSDQDGDDEDGTIDIPIPDLNVNINADGDFSGGSSGGSAGTSINVSIPKLGL